MNNTELSVRTAGLRIGIRTWDILNTEDNFCTLHYDVRAVKLLQYMQPKILKLNISYESL